MYIFCVPRLPDAERNYSMLVLVVGTGFSVNTQRQLSNTRTSTPEKGNRVSFCIWKSKELLTVGINIFQLKSFSQGNKVPWPWAPVIRRRVWTSGCAFHLSAPDHQHPWAMGAGGALGNYAQISWVPLAETISCYSLEPCHLAQCQVHGTWASSAPPHQSSTLLRPALCPMTLAFMFLIKVPACPLASGWVWSIVMSVVYSSTLSSCGGCRWCQSGGQFSCQSTFSTYLFLPLGSSGCSLPLHFSTEAATAPCRCSAGATALSLCWFS